jgi:hypothetical protein
MDKTSQKYQCLCSAGQKPDSKDPKKCIQVEQYSSDLPSSQLKRRRSMFSKFSIVMMFLLVITAVFYWHKNRRRGYTNFQQFINPAFET